MWFVRVEECYWKETYVDDTLLEDIDRIEVISGPGGTLWGANAVNGVISVMTKDAAETQGFLATAGGGTYEQDFTAARYGARGAAEGDAGPDRRHHRPARRRPQEAGVVAETG